MTRAPAPPRFRTYLRLGRISNLPTVWTNVIAGIVLSRAPADAGTTLRLVAAISSLYVAGMFLNDAFDRHIDARERPERPIPSGAIPAAEVFVVGFALMLAGVGLVAANRAVLRHESFAAIGSAAALALLVLLYDAWHKQNPLAPVVMGLCRGAIYVTAALGAGGFLGPTILSAAVALAAYVTGLTFVARQENRKSYRAGLTLGLLGLPAAVVLGHSPGAATVAALLAVVAWVIASVRPLFASASVDVGRSVVRLIAGISLVDALLVVSTGAVWLGAMCALGWAATLGLQRVVKGT